MSAVATFDPIRIVAWRPLRKGVLLGFAKVELPSGIILSSVAILQNDRGPWASPPSKPTVGRDGVVMKDAEGKTMHAPLVEFASKQLWTEFSTAVIEALRAAHPGAIPTDTGEKRH